MSRASRKRRAEAIWIRNSMTARFPPATMAPSSARCFAPRRVTASGNSANSLAHEMDVLDLDVAGWPQRRFEQEIDAGVGAVLHLAAHGVVAGKLGDHVRRDGFSSERIRMDGVDSYELDACSQVHLDQFPAVGKLAQRVPRLRQPYARARDIETNHRSRIGAVHGHGLARGQHDIGEKALVAPHQRGGKQRRGETHL
jgi:hypothetical protein